ncbi:DNA polymerase III subunit delta [bacterium]|nr:DNA polymerase III subunit delta [bacterium]
MAEDFRSLLNQVNAGKIAPVYFFYGDEPYPVDKIVRLILQKVLDPATRDFNFDSFQGEEAEMDQVIAVARSFPMMSDRRAVLVKSLQKFTPSDRNKLLDYVRSPLESSCLVLVADKADRRQKFWGELAANSLWVESKTLYENQAVEWVIQQARKYEAEISQDAARMMVQQVGCSLWNLAHEIEKLLTFAWGKKRLGREDVLMVVGLSREYNTWEFTDAVARRDTRESIRILVHLMDSKQSAVGIIMDLSRRMLILMRLKLLAEKRVPQDQAARQAGLRPYFARLFAEQSGLFTVEEIRQAVQSLYLADLAVKTGRLDPLMTLTLLVYELTQSRGTRYFK